MLDACVLIPAALRDTLLRAADAGLYRLHWSDQILEEVHRNLVLDFGVPEQGALHLLRTMRGHFPEAMTSGYEALIDSMANDPKDRHVLAAAVASNSHLIVTSNLRHFPPRALAPLDIEAWTPDEFLVHLLVLDSRSMVRIIREQAAALQSPPTTFEQVLRALSYHAPMFAAAVEQRTREGG